MIHDVHILIKAQLSRDYLDGLRQRYGANISIQNFSEVQSSAVVTLWRNLRRIAPELLLIPAEDENSRCVLPVMKLIALATRARRIAVVGADYAVTPLSKFAAASALGSLATASLASIIGTLTASIEVAGLVRRPSHALASGAVKRLLYINANLWFGVKAGGSVGHISGVINALLGKGIGVDFASCGTRLMVRDAAKYVPLQAPKAFGVPFEINYYRFSRYVARLLGHNPEKRRYDAIYQRLSLANEQYVFTVIVLLSPPLITLQRNRLT